MRIFLAHSSAQRSECDKIVAKLRARGFGVFYSPDTIAPSEEYDRQIRSEIARCGAMIFVLSPQSVAEGCYAMTELAIASQRWPNPRRRVLAVVAAECPVPPYLKDTIELLKPRGDLATETADEMVAIRNRRRRIARLVASGPAIATMALATAFFWHTRLAAQARLDAVTDGLLAAAKNAHVYMDTCVIPLDRFSDYVHHPTLPAHACDVKPVIESLRLPALVVAQTGNGKRGFLQSLRATLALRGRPSVLVTYRDCVRGGPKDVEVNLAKCLTAGVAADTHASVDDAEKWLADPKRYVLIFDAVDDSASREKIFRLVQALWQHQQEGGPVVLSSQ